MHRKNIRELIKQGNITTLEEIVFQGYGDRLLGETSFVPIVQDFLNRVPSLLVSKKINLQTTDYFTFFKIFIKI